MNIHVIGMGRIGRRFIQIASLREYNNCEITFSDQVPIEEIFYLLKYDSIYGVNNNISIVDNNIILMNGKKFKYEENYINSEIIVDCTGKNIATGKNRTILSYPSDHKTFIFGVDTEIGKENIISNGSCTTNAIAPVLKSIIDIVEEVNFTTIHAYTSDQNIVDTYHKDRYRGRAAALSMVPTSTGASKLLEKIFSGVKIIGKAIRVPVPNVSCVDLTCLLKEKISREELINNFSKSKYIGINYDKAVSIDFIGREESAIIDANSIKISNRLLNLTIWYDNEHAYACRLFELTMKSASDLQ